MRNWEWKFYKRKELGGTQTSFFPPILVVNWVSSRVSFSWAPAIAVTYIFTAPTCTTTIIILEPCALNAESQHFIPSFNQNFLTLLIPLKERIGTKAEEIGGGTEGDFTDNSNVQTHPPVNMYLSSNTFQYFSHSLTKLGNFCVL
jgi:hypothetical protein